MRIIQKSAPNQLWTAYTCYGIFTGDNTSIMELVYIYYGIYVGSNTLILPNYIFATVLITHNLM